jgi:hypothetical protein
MTPNEDEITKRVDERTDLVDRFIKGDLSALAELLEYATGAKVLSIKPIEKE